MKSRPSQALDFRLFWAPPLLRSRQPAGCSPATPTNTPAPAAPGPYPDPPEGMGDVGGSAPYSTDSDICRAAQHAGVLGPEGGEVTAIRVPRRKASGAAAPRTA
jgi:hypothetical protein